MLNIMQNYKENKKAAFSYCISADIGNSKHMSAGIAVCFKKRFGKPQQSDCINEFLTYQKRNQGASVYGLFTKPSKYFNIPTL